MTKEDQLTDLVVSIVEKHGPMMEGEIFRRIKQTFFANDLRQVRDILNRETNNREGRLDTVIETRYKKRGIDGS